MDSNNIVEVRNLLIHARRCCLPTIALVALLLIGTLGCSPGKLPVSDISQARTMLEDSLRSWKNGKTPGDLRNADPPIYFSEELWENGSELVEYSIADQGSHIGANVRFEVLLKTKLTSGKQQTQTVKYVITTQPAQTVARLDL